MQKLIPCFLVLLLSFSPAFAQTSCEEDESLLTIEDCAQHQRMAEQFKLQNLAEQQRMTTNLLKMIEDAAKMLSQQIR